MLPSWRNRITEHAELDPRTLHPHPQNPRMHPLAQQEAVGAALREVGVIHPILVSQRTSTILNGHLRVDLAIQAGAETIPASLIDVTPDEEVLILAIFDRIASMADTDPERLHVLLSEVETKSDAFQALLDSYAAEFGQQLAALELPPEEPTEPKAKAPETMMVRVGIYYLNVSHAAFEAWQNRIFQEVGTEDAALEAEYRRRLQIDD